MEFEVMIHNSIQLIVLSRVNREGHSERKGLGQQRNTEHMHKETGSHCNARNKEGVNSSWFYILKTTSGKKEK
jgi:hypothetical protein